MHVLKKILFLSNNIQLKNVQRNKKKFKVCKGFRRVTL